MAFDVGANYGQTVEEMLAAIPSAAIYSFEPVPTTFAVLHANTRRYSNVECIHSALGDSDGTVQITLSETTGQNTINTSAKPGTATAHIPITTIDAFCGRRGIARIDVLKIDTEGYEMSVLRGARGMLESGAIQLVLAECEFVHNPSEPHGDFAEIFALLSPMGYRIVSFYTGGVDGDGWRWGDALFMRPNGKRSVTCSPFA